MNVLFICSRNQWRSRTADTLFRNHGTHRVKSAGTSASARIRVSASLIDWADSIYVMEDRHLELLKDRFPIPVSGKHIEVLGIPDDYHYMDPVLIEELRELLEDIFA